MYMAIVKQYIAFENACKDQIDMACTKEGLMHMVEKEWSKYVKNDKE